MIPSDIRLYTWIDVEDVLIRQQQQQQWPSDLIWARAYWDSLLLGIRPQTKEHVLAWLEVVFDPRLQTEDDQCNLILESLQDQERILPIYFEESDETLPDPKVLPSFARPLVIWSAKDLPLQEISPSPELHFPPVIVFHSFKGGVGRTTHAAGLALAMSE